MRKLGSLLLLLAITAVGAASAAAPEPSRCARERRRATRDPSLSASVGRNRAGSVHGSAEPVREYRVSVRSVFSFEIYGRTPMETAPMKTALSCHDRMAHVVVEFIHHKARSLADEIARAEAAICAMSEISISAEGTLSDTEARPCSGI